MEKSINHPKYGYIKRLPYHLFLKKHRECGVRTDIHLLWRKYAKNRGTICPECNE